MSTKTVKVLIVDDSALIRKLLTELISSDPGLEVIGAARDPYDAREKIKALKPDVITLDVEMPKMDGITFLRNLMKLHPLPVVMVSTLTEKGAEITFEAMELGAIDFVTKPKIDVTHGLNDYREEIVEKVKIASCANRERLHNISSNLSSAPPKYSADAILRKPSSGLKFKATDKIIAIGASTGGTEAIKEVLVNMPPDSPAIVITQHIPEAFSTPFTSRMNKMSPMIVNEATDGQQIVPGNVYIAPGNRHLIVERSGARYICRLNDGPPVNRHKPAVDVMFRSIAQNVGKNCIGILLTGMGDDGANGMKEMHDNGAETIVQDEKTSVVWGMPGEAVKLGCVDNVYPLNKIADEILKLVKE